MNLTRMTYTLVLAASVCCMTGIAVLSHTEGDETEWID